MNAIDQSGVFTVKSCRASLIADISGNCVVDFNDFGWLAGQWLDCGDPCDANCIE